MIARRTKRDPIWEHVEGGVTRDENGWALVYLAVRVEGQVVGQVITVLHDRVINVDPTFRRTLENMVRDIDIKIKYRLEK